MGRRKKRIYFNRLGCQGEMGQNAVWAKQRMKLFLQFPF
jgi:hypothetical protein